MAKLKINNNYIELNALNIVCAISGGAMLLLVAPRSSLYSIIFFLSGLMIGYVEGLLCRCPKSRKPIEIVELIIIVIISIIILKSSFKSFYVGWASSPEIQSLVSRITPRTGSFLMIASIALSVASFPALFLALRAIVGVIGRYFYVIQKSSLLKYVFCDGQIFCKSVAMIIVNILLATVLGVVLLMGAYSLPLNNIEKNVQDSASIMSEEGANRVIFSWCSSELDNFTDSLMLLEAADDSEGNVVDKAIKAQHGIINEENPNDILVEHFENGTAFTEKEVYSRYWHGYQIILKPLLEFMNYSEIRVVNIITQLLLVIIIGLLLFKNNMGNYFPAYVIAYFMLMPVTLGYCMQYSSCYYGLSLGSIVLLLLSDEHRKKYGYLVFLNIGIFTAYFDFLTYPVATFGIPAIFFIALETKESIGKRLGDLIKNGLAWVVGYIGMWSAKCLVSYLLIGYNAFSEAFGALVTRVSDVNPAGGTYSRMFCEVSNYSSFVTTPIIFFYVLFALYLIVTIYNKRGAARTDYANISLPYFIVAIIPVLWYAFTINHSSLHVYFTNKACVVSFLAFLFSLVNTKEKCISQPEIINKYENQAKS